MADFVIETEKTVISDDIGVWYYSSLLLQDNDYENTGLNQAHLLAWLKKENKGKIIDDYIKKGLIIKKPKGKTDIIKICGFTIIINKELESDFEEDYCVKFSDLMIFNSIKQPGFDKNNNPAWQVLDKFVFLLILLKIFKNKLAFSFVLFKILQGTLSKEPFANNFADTSMILSEIFILLKFKSLE